MKMKTLVAEYLKLNSNVHLSKFSRKQNKRTEMKTKRNLENKSISNTSLIEVPERELLKKNG